MPLGKVAIHSSLSTEDFSCGDKYKIHRHKYPQYFISKAGALWRDLAHGGEGLGSFRQALHRRSPPALHHLRYTTCVTSDASGRVYHDASGRANSLSGENKTV